MPSLLYRGYSEDAARRLHKTPLPADHSCRQPEALGQPTGSDKLNRACVDGVSRPRKRGERTPAALRGSVMAGGIGMGLLSDGDTSPRKLTDPKIDIGGRVCYYFF